MVPSSDLAQRLTRHVRAARFLNPSPQEIAHLLTSELAEQGLDLRREPSLEEIKVLFSAALMAARPDLPSTSGGGDVPPSLAGERPMEILLIEDSLTYARMTMRALENSGLPHRLTWLARGDEALAALRRRGRYAELERPDLILLDLTLPGIDGRDVLATIRDDADLARIPVIVLTASNDAEDRNVSMLQGVRKYLTKPVRPSELLDVVCRLKSAEAEVV